MKIHKENIIEHYQRNLSTGFDTTTGGAMNGYTHTYLNMELNVKSIRYIFYIYTKNLLFPYYYTISISSLATKISDSCLSTLKRHIRTNDLRPEV